MTTTAGAATHHVLRPFGTTGTTAPSGSSRKHLELPPLTSGYLEAVDAAGTTSYTPGSVQIDSGQADGFTVELDAPAFPGQIPGVPLKVSVQPAPGQSLAVGAVYGTGATGSVSVTSTNNCSSGVAGSTAQAEVDQIEYDNAGNVVGIAVQFQCSVASGPYQAYYGALADGAVPTTAHQGYYTYESDGQINAFGNDAYLNYLGDLSASPLNSPIVGMTQTADGAGYWLVASDGGIFAYGDAPFYGSTGNIHLNKPVVGMTPTRDGAGYWFVATDGGIFAYGDAAFHGSTGALTLNSPIAGMAADPNGPGYWLVAADGGIFAFDVPYFGSLPGAGVAVGDVMGIST